MARCFAPLPGVFSLGYDPSGDRSECVGVSVEALMSLVIGEVVDIESLRRDTGHLEGALDGPCEALAVEEAMPGGECLVGPARH